MATSNSSIDWTKLMSQEDQASVLATPEFREWLVSLLATNTITVTFTKKDGTERIMKCTRNSAFIPTEQLPKEGSEKSTTSIPVFDLEAQGWRSFIASNITRIEYDV